METYFENRHIHDLAYLKEYYLHTIKTVPKGLILWLVLAAGCLVFLVVDLMAGNFIMSIVYVALAALCLLRGFLGEWLQLRQSYLKAASKYEKASWETVVTLGEDICLTDDGRQSMHIDWRNCQQLRQSGGWIHLRMRDRMGELRIRKSDFTVGTAEAFCQWLAQTHPEIRQRGGMLPQAKNMEGTDTDQVPVPFSWEILDRRNYLFW